MKTQNVEQKKVIKMSLRAIHRIIMLVITTGAWLTLEKLGFHGAFALLILIITPAEFSIAKSFGPCPRCGKKTLLEISTWNGLLILYFYYKDHQKAPKRAQIKKVKKCIPCKKEIA